MAEPTEIVIFRPTRIRDLQEKADRDKRKFESSLGLFKENLRETASPIRILKAFPIASIVTTVTGLFFTRFAARLFLKPLSGKKGLSKLVAMGQVWPVAQWLGKTGFKLLAPTMIGFFQSRKKPPKTE